MNKKKLLEILDDNLTARRIAVKIHGCADSFNNQTGGSKEESVEEVKDVLDELKTILIQQGVL